MSTLGQGRGNANKGGKVDEEFHANKKGRDTNNNDGFVFANNKGRDKNNNDGGKKIVKYQFHCFYCKIFWLLRMQFLEKIK